MAVGPAMFRALSRPLRARDAQMSATHVQPRELNLASDSQASSERDGVGEGEDKLITALAKQLSD